MNENAIADARALRAGQRLRIPGLADAPASDVKPPITDAAPPPVPAPALETTAVVYVVRGGDTLSAIAARLGVTVQSIVDANHLTDPRLIRPGQQLIIPPAALVLSAATFEITKPAARVYVTRKGDTIARVAELFQVDAQALADKNRVGRRGEILPGTRLKIPVQGN